MAPTTTSTSLPLHSRLFPPVCLALRPSERTDALREFFERLPFEVAVFETGLELAAHLITWSQLGEDLCPAPILVVAEERLPGLLGSEILEAIRDLEMNTAFLLLDVDDARSTGNTWSGGQERSIQAVCEQAADLLLEAVASRWPRSAVGRSNMLQI